MKLKILSVLMVTIIISHNIFSQKLHKLEAPKGHYLSLSKLSGEPNPARSHLDEIKFPSDSYNSGSLIYLMAEPVYLTSSQIDQLKLSSLPPANSSDQVEAELAFLLDWQKKRTKIQADRAANVLAPIGYWPHISLIPSHPRFQSNLEDLFFEGRTVLGDQCKAENYPATTKLLEGVTKDMRIMEFTVKYHLLRPRPYQLSNELQPLARMSTPSYASGHTLWAYIQAYVWSELVPHKRIEFLNLAYEIGESREIMGIHYPSDEEAARVLAHNMLNAMFESQDFRKDFEMAKSEWK